MSESAHPAPPVRSVDLDVDSDAADAGAFTVLTSPDAFTASWFTAALRGRYPGVEVSAFEVLEETTGVTTRHRVALDYAAGSGPRSVFVKTTTDATHDELFGAQEARLYTCGEQLPLEMPRCYASATDGDRSVLVLEDLTGRDASMNLALTPFTVDAARSGLAGLGAMHARYWGERLSQSPSMNWVEPFKYALFAENADQVASYVAGRAEELGMLDLLPPRLRDLRVLVPWWGLPPEPGPRTLVHGDPHVGNTYTLPDSSIGFLDWQLASESSWEHDIGYFLIGCLNVEDRRRHERELLEGYLDGLRVGGAMPPTFDEAWARYRRAPVYGLVVWLLTATTTDAHLQSVCDECTTRFAAAFEDLETEAAFG